MKVNKNPALASGARFNAKTGCIDFLNIFYDKSADISILIKFANGPYPAILCALAKAKIEQIELEKKGGLL